MADTKTTALTENTTPVSTDIIYMVDDPGASPLSQKMTLATLDTFIKATGGRTLISEQTPTGTGTVTFSSIPATYRSLELEVVARSTQAATSVDLYCRFNNDTTATNYRYTVDYGYGTNTEDAVGDATYSLGGCISGGTAPAGSCGAVKIKVINYASTTFNKVALAEWASRRDDSSIFLIVGNVGMEWESTSAINRVDLVISAGNYDTGTTVRLYGVY